MAPAECSTKPPSLYSKMDGKARRRPSHAVNGREVLSALPPHILKDIPVPPHAHRSGSGRGHEHDRDNQKRIKRVAKDEDNRNSVMSKPKKTLDARVSDCENKSKSAVETAKIHISRPRQLRSFSESNTMTESRHRNLNNPSIEASALKSSGRKPGNTSVSSVSIMFPRINSRASKPKPSQSSNYLETLLARISRTQGRISTLHSQLEEKKGKLKGILKEMDGKENMKAERRVRWRET